MRNTKWLLAAGLIAATTAACTTDSGYYPSTSYNSGYYAPSTAAYYPSSSAYYPSTSRGYYSNSTAYNNSYYTANRTPRRGPTATTTATAFRTATTATPTATAFPTATSAS